MGAHVAETVVKLMLQSGIGVCNSRVLILGLAFKENCPDLRNTRVVDIIDALREYRIRVDGWPVRSVDAMLTLGANSGTIGDDGC